MKRNILVLNYEFPPIGGGQANANYYLFKEFSKQKQYHFILITSSSDTYKKEIFSDNITIHYLDIGKKNKNLHTQSIKDLLKNGFYSYKFAKQVIKNKKIDKIMAWSYPAIGLAYIFKKLYKIPYIVLLRGSDVPFYAKKWKLLDKYIFQFLAPLFWRNATHVIANSQGLRQLAIDTSQKQQIDVIANGVDNVFFKAPQKKEDKDDIIILGVGRLAEVKSFHMIIDAVADINNSRVEVWLIGEGPEKEKLASLAQDKSVKLKLFGYQNKQELQKIYQQSDIFCLPSQNEGMSNTLLEGISSGLPVVVTDVGGSKELVHKNGYIIEKNNQDALKEKLKILIQDKEFRIKMGLKSSDFAKKLGWDKIALEFKKYL